MTVENKPERKSLGKGKKNNRHSRNPSVRYLGSQFERVDFLSLLAQSLIHTTQVVAHHAELVFIAPLSCSQFILHEEHRCVTIRLEEFDIYA